MTKLLPITKLATDSTQFVRTGRYFPSARAAFGAYLRSLQIGPEDTVLLPAYIGWSSREGSGVFDPVVEAGCRYAFYRLTPLMQVDHDDYVDKLETHRPRVIVLIHYYGFPDPQLPALARRARAGGAKVLEDEAHALLTDWVGGACGRYGDVAIASLHKLFPVSSGGLLILNRFAHDEVRPGSLGSIPPTELLNWDYAAIAAARRRNARLLMELLRPLAGRVDLLFDALPSAVVPQTLPVLIRRVSRDQLYFDLNAAGFGVVSLYHTLIDAIPPDQYPDSYRLARQIMNLPVHQDVAPEQLEAMVVELERLS